MDRNISSGPTDGGMMILFSNKELVVGMECKSVRGKNAALLSAQDGLSKDGCAMCLEFSGNNFSLYGSICKGIFSGDTMGAFWKLSYR